MPSKAVRLLHALFTIALCVSGSAQGAVSLELMRALPSLPAAYSEEPSYEARVQWLQRQLANDVTAVERYRLASALFYEHFNERRMSEAAKLCEENPPIVEDVSYRGHCILATHPAYEDHLPKMLALAEEARRMPDLAAAARILRDAAWRQSQAGDIAGSFEHFEAALSIAPAEDVELLGEIMMDTAVTYIVNGDPAYIRKGIDLLGAARQRVQGELDDPESTADKALLQDQVFLTEFNTGIAYLLHLSEPENALVHFERVGRKANAYRLDGLVFAALSSAELGRFDEARRFLRGADREDGAAAGPVVQQYLRCYRELAVRHWDRTQSLSSCLALKPETPTEVQLDVYKRLSSIEDPSIKLAGLAGLKTLFVETFEPQLRRRGAIAASTAELTRLQRESELKSLVLTQQRELQREREATATQRQHYFIALSLLLVTAILLVASKWRSNKKLADQLERLSVIDPLTRLGNRRFLEQNIERELSQIDRARRTDPDVKLGIFLFDIDHFKSINDQYGHSAGDEVLQAFSQRIQWATRKTDLLVRWGGEEFLLIARLDGASRAEQVAERILDSVSREPFAITGQAPITVTCTIGGALYPFLDDDLRDSWPRLVRLADMALYEGKATGRNRWVIANNASTDSVEALDEVLASPLREAVEAGRISLATP